MRSLTCSSRVLPCLPALCCLLLGAGASSDADAQQCIPFIPGTVTTAGGQVLLLPDGSGPSLQSQGATITLQLWECPGEPYALANYPAQDMWLDGDGSGTLAFCAPGAIADGPTDEYGITTFARALAGGGWNTSVLFVRAVGITLETNSIAFVSPDVNGDLVVGLADFAAFGQEFMSYGTRSDFNFDGAVDLNDFSIFGRAFGAHCP